MTSPLPAPSAPGNHDDDGEVGLREESLRVEQRSAQHRHALLEFLFGDPLVELRRLEHAITSRPVRALRIPQTPRTTSPRYSRGSLDPVSSCDSSSAHRASKASRERLRGAKAEIGARCTPICSTSLE